MIRSEKFLSNVVKKKLLKEWKSPQDLPKNLKTVLKHLIIDEKNLRETYLLLKSNNEQFNRYLILKLLELQSDAAFEFKQIVSKQKRIQNTERLYENISDLLFFNLDLSDIFEDKFLCYEHYITRVIFKLKEIDEFESLATSLIAHRFSALKYDTFTREKFAEQKIQFIISIILTMVTVSIREGDFSFIKALQKEFSISYNELEQDNYMSLIFALVSMQFYFICHDSQNASEELKSKIKEYINYSDVINHTKVYSWKDLYIGFAREFKVDIKTFMKYFSISEKNWDVPLYYEAQWVKLTQSYAFRWYLTHVLNSFEVDHYDYSSLCFDETCKFYLKEFCEKCFDKDKNFIATDEMKSVLDFYGLEEKPFQYFLSWKGCSLKLFNFVNELKKADLFDADKIDKSKTNDEIANKYRKAIQNAIENEWGYNSNIEITSSPKVLVVLIEKFSRAINYEEVMGDTLVRSLFHELRTNIVPVVILRKEDTDNGFDENMNLLLTDNIEMSSEMAERLQYYIKSNAFRDKFIELYSNTKKFNSNILTGYIFIKKGGFGFNVKFNEFSVRDLTIEELGEEVEKYKSADGQYVYEGTFLSREEIERLLFQQYAVLKITMQYAVMTNRNDIFEVKLF